MPELYHWAQLFKATTWEEIAMLAKQNETINECVVTLKELSEDERIRMECQAREDLRRDFASATELGLRRGEELGIERGEKIGIERGEKIGKEIGKIMGITQAFRALGKSKQETAEYIRDDLQIDLSEAEQKVAEYW